MYHHPNIVAGIVDLVHVVLFGDLTDRSESFTIVLGLQVRQSLSTVLFERSLILVVQFVEQCINIVLLFGQLPIEHLTPIYLLFVLLVQLFLDFFVLFFDYAKLFQLRNPFGFLNIWRRSMNFSLIRKCVLAF